MVEEIVLKILHRPQRATSATAETDEPMRSPTTPVSRAAGGRRPRLNLEALGMGGNGERKRGKSMFGVLMNTLNKAKAEDKERSASEAVRRLLSILSLDLESLTCLYFVQ